MFVLCAERVACSRPLHARQCDFHCHSFNLNSTHDRERNGIPDDERDVLALNIGNEVYEMNKRIDLDFFDCVPGPVFKNDTEDRRILKQKNSKWWKSEMSLRRSREQEMLTTNYLKITHGSLPNQARVCRVPCRGLLGLLTMLCAFSHAKFAGCDDKNVELWTEKELGHDKVI